MKKAFKYFFIFLITIIVFAVIINYPISSSPKNLGRLSDTSEIRKDLESIINTSKPRNFQNVDILNNVSKYIQAEFSKTTNHVSEQFFTVQGNNYKNVIASFGPQNAERIIVGAHYDVCLNQDGADDNASGATGLIALARLLRAANLKYRIDLVAYSLEEPPFFDTENMGSYVHAKSLHDNKIQVKGMISLEMIGYFSNEENSQSYPVGLLKWFYGNKGDFITIVQKIPGGSFASNFKKQFFLNNSIQAKSIKAPSFFGGIDLSDHMNYWKFGYSAVMVTNTAFYRNQSYHTGNDVLKSLNIPNMGLVVDGMYRAIVSLQ